jgi:cellulose synthase/poly-beta-1,6-N-acetylglucosamine synthase-like glycosyltransferase
MLDIGTKPQDDSIRKLYKYMRQNKNCGGCCGEIEVDLNNNKSSFSYLIKAA